MGILTVYSYGRAETKTDAPGDPFIREEPHISNYVPGDIVRDVYMLSRWWSIVLQRVGQN